MRYVHRSWQFQVSSSFAQGYGDRSDQLFSSGTSSPKPQVQSPGRMENKPEEIEVGMTGIDNVEQEEREITEGDFSSKKKSNVQGGKDRPLEPGELNCY